MWWPTYIILLFSVHLLECQNVSISDEELERMYHIAIAEVLEQNAEASSRSRTPPYFKMPDNFMRSFVPGTGVGNREELVIDGMFSLNVHEDIASSKVLFKHFNNTDYVAGISEKYEYMYLMKIQKSTDNLVLSVNNIILTSYVEKGLIKDVVLFTRITENTEVFSVAVATQTPKASVIYVYEVYGDYGEMVSMIDLNIDPSTSSSTVKRIAYVQSSYAGSLVVLTDRVRDKRLTFNNRGDDKLNHFIEVGYSSAVDLVTFTVHGHGYIAVTDNEFCEIYKMDAYVNRDIYFDRLNLQGIVDLEYFRLGFHHFLAVASYEEIYLYTWNKGEFALKQTLPVSYLSKVSAVSVESCRDEVMLFSIMWNGDVGLYVFDGMKEVFKNIDIAVPEGYSVLGSSTASFTNQDNAVILFYDFNYKLGGFVIKTSLKYLRDPALVEGEEASKVMKRIQETIDNQRKEVERIKQSLENAVRTSGTQRITSMQYFDNIVATSGATIEKVNKFVVEWEDSALTLEEYRRGTDDLEATIDSLEELVAKIENEISDVVRLDEDTVITGQKIFTGQVSADELVTTHLNLQNVAGIDLPQLQKDIYRLDNPEVIDGTLTFMEPLTVTGDFDVDTTINGIDISEEVMTVNTEQTSNAQISFTNPLLIRGDLDVSGKINDIDISEEVVTLHGAQTITAPKNFLGGIKVEDLETKFLDDVDISELYSKALTISGNQFISADASFTSMITNNITLKGKLNGYDVKEIAESIVRVDQPAVITELKSFMNDVTIEGELIVNGSVNGLKIPDDLVLADKSQVITGTKEFLGEVTATDVTVHGLVDGVKLPEDVVTLSKDEEIPGNLYFAYGIAAEKDIVVEGLVDNVDISEIAKQAMKLDESNAFKHALFLGPVKITGNLNVKGKINNIDLNTLLGDIVYKDENPITINAKKTFKKVYADKVQLHRSINGFNISVDFMKVAGDQNIAGTKTFKNSVFNSIFIEDGMINGVNITDLYQMRIGAEIEKEKLIDRELHFMDTVFVKNLVVQGTIGDFSISDIVRRNSSQPISNKHFTNRVTVDNLIIDGDITVDNFAGIDLKKLYDDRITLSGDQRIPGDIWLGNTTATKVFIDGPVNDMNLDEFISNIMSKSKPQVVTATKEFLGDVVIHGNVTTSGVNDKNLADINRRAFKLSGDNIVTAEFEFKDNITLENLNVMNINGVNITRLNEDSLKKTGDIQFVKGDVTFEKGFDVLGDITATKVNDLTLKEDILLKTIPQTIKGQFTFKNMAINGDLTVKGLINGLDIIKTTQNLAKINEEETVIESNVTFTGALHVQENIDVSGKVNDVNLKKLFENVLTNTEDQTVTGHKIFRGTVTITGDVNVTYVNEVNWAQFIDDVVWINKPQVIHSRKVFENDVSVNSMFVTGDVNVRMINNNDLERFQNDAVFIDEPADIIGPIVFKNPVEISGDLDADLINGLNLKTDVITIMCLEDPQIITGHKSFQNVKVYGDILADSVNSYDLQALYADTLLTVGNQNITGRKIIHGDVVFKENVYPDTVNGIIPNKDLVTLDDEQLLEGPLIFQGDVNVIGDMFIDGLVNGVDLYNLSRDVFDVESEQVIEGTYKFDKAVVRSDVQVDGLVNNIDLQDLNRNVTQFLSETKDSIFITQKQLEDQCQIAKYLQESLKDSYYDLDGFILHQDFEFPASSVQVTSDCVTLVYVNDSPETTTSVKHVWDRDAKKFFPSNFTASSVAKSLSYKLGKLGLVIEIGLNIKDSSIRVDVAGNQRELDKDFVDASVIVRGKDAVIALISSNKGKCEVYLLKEDPVVAYSYELDSKLEHISEDASSIALFEVSGRLYLAVSSSHSPFIRGDSQIFAKKDGDWQLTQRIQTSGSFVKHFEYKNYHYLAFANNAPIHETKEPKSIQIYRNSGRYESKFILFQKVLFDDARGVELFSFGDLKQLHMVAWNATRISVFGLEGESGMTERFTIYEKWVRDVKPLLMSDNLYLVVGRQNLKKTEAVTSILYKGLIKGIKYEPYSLNYC